jgi:uncharacterized RDD family membrane protein YckC
VTRGMVAVRRATARLVDSLAELLLAWGVLGWFVEDRNGDKVLDPPWPIVVAVAIGLLLYEIGILRAFGATPGKLLMKIHVERRDGGPLRTIDAVRRVLPAAVVVTVFVAVPALGGLMPYAVTVLYALALFTTDGRGPVDRIGGTRVESNLAG